MPNKRNKNSKFPINLEFSLKELTNLIKNSIFYNFDILNQFMHTKYINPYIIIPFKISKHPRNLMFLNIIIFIFQRTKKRTKLTQKSPLKFLTSKYKKFSKVQHKTKKRLKNQKAQSNKLPHLILFKHQQILSL